MSPDSVKLIDLARITAGYPNRTEFILEAIMEKTRAVLKIQRASDEERRSA